MASKYLEENKIDKYFDCNKQTKDENKFKRKLLDLIAIIPSVYAEDNGSRENEKILFIEGVNKVCEKLKSLFSGPSDSTSLKIEEQYPEIQNIVDKCTTSAEKTNAPCYSFLSKYLQNCQRINKNSLCKNVSSLKTNESRFFRVCTDSQLQDFANRAAVMAKLRKYLKQHYQRAPINSKLHIPCKASKSLSSSKTKTIIQPTKHCDKAIQCTKANEFLKVTPNLKFTSSSSVKLESKPQLENFNSSKLANYRTEFPRRLNELRCCCSTSAIRDSQRNYSKTGRRFEFIADRDTCKLAPTYRLKRREKQTKTDHLRRAETEILHYSTFIEDDLSPYRDREFDRNDVLAMKKILLQDYITEIQEIIRTECNDEARVLNNVRRRLDEDFSSVHSESWHSLSDCTSYATARESFSIRDYHRLTKENSECWECEDPRICRSCCDRKKLGFPKVVKSCVSCTDHKIRNYKIGIDESDVTKSSQSVDSGVLVDYARPSNDWCTSDDSCSTSSSNVSIRFAEKLKKKKEIEKPVSPNSEFSNDELMCKKVESAVRKFTDELIVCERRVKNRSTSTRKIRRKCQVPSDESDCDTFDSLKNSFSSSEEENLTSVSAPSLVSLSD